MTGPVATERALRLEWYPVGREWLKAAVAGFTLYVRTDNFWWEAAAYSSCERLAVGSPGQCSTAFAAQLAAEDAAERLLLADRGVRVLLGLKSTEEVFTSAEPTV